MNVTLEQWRQADYNHLLQHLASLADPKYQAFYQRLVPEEKHLLGVRIPLLHSLAKSVAKGNAQSFLEIALPRTDCYEATLLTGLVISKQQGALQEVWPYLEQFIPQITNWSVCDTVCAALKIVRKHRVECFKKIQQYLQAEEEYTVRFGLVLLLFHYIEADYPEARCYLPQILQLCDGIQHQGYYVKMAAAWLLSICFIKFQTQTENYLQNCNLDDWTYNKTLQKITESSRVEDAAKAAVRAKKRK